MASGGGRESADFYLGEPHAGLLWRAIAAKGLDAEDFEFGASKLRGYSWTLTHEPTGQALHGSHGIAEYNDDHRYFHADLLVTRPDGDPSAWEGATLDHLLDVVKEWADQLKAVQRRGGGPTPIGSADSQAEENRPFTPAEQTEITNQLRAVRDSVRKNYRLTAEQYAAIDRSLKEAEAASKRLSIKEWKSLFYGVVFGLIVNDAIPPEVAQHIFTGVLHGIAHLLGGGGVPPWMLGG